MEEGVVPALCVHSSPREKTHELCSLEAEKCQAIDRIDKVPQVSRGEIASTERWWKTLKGGCISRRGKRRNRGSNDSRDTNLEKEACRKKDPKIINEEIYTGKGGCGE